MCALPNILNGTQIMQGLLWTRTKDTSHSWPTVIKN